VEVRGAILLLFEMRLFGLGFRRPFIFSLVFRILSIEAHEQRTTENSGVTSFCDTHSTIAFENLQIIRLRFMICMCAPWQKGYEFRKIVLQKVL